MACYPVQCLVPPCPEYCDEGPIIGPDVTSPYNYQPSPLASRTIDPALLMYAPKTITRNPGTYSGGQYPSSYAPGYAPVPDFTTETESLDYWRIVLLAFGVLIGVLIIKRS